MGKDRVIDAFLPICESIGPVRRQQIREKEF
jgi:hypothetical protein